MDVYCVLWKNDNHAIYDVEVRQSLAKAKKLAVDILNDWGYDVESYEDIQKEEIQEELKEKTEDVKVVRRKVVS